MEDLISIVIPVYNKEKVIDNCIESIINQSYKKIEILLIDDGSNDYSLEKCKEWQKKDNRVNFYSKKNGGSSSARNYGIKRATGKFVLFIDADDYLCNNMIEKLYYNMIFNDVELSICDYNVERFNKVEAINNTEKITILNQLDFYKNLKQYRGYCWNKLFVLEIVKKIMFDEKIHYCEDLLFCVKYNELIKKSCYSNLKLYNYVLDNNNFTAQNWNERKITVLDAYEQIIDITKKYEKNIYKQFYISYFIFFNEINHLYKKNKEKKKNKKLYIDLKRFELNKKEKNIIFCKYRLFYLYLLARWIYHNICRR